MQISGRWPNTRFTERRVRLGHEFVVAGWTAPATRADGRQFEWMGSEAIESRAVLVCANYVYSSSHAPRLLDRDEPACAHGRG